MQHGLIDYATMVSGLIAMDAGGGTGVVRVPANDAAAIGKALDAGAHGIIVPLIETAEEAAAAVSACRYPPAGRRSYGPVRSHLRIGPDPKDANSRVACIVMIETASALANIEAICATPGLDGVYVGPNDLGLALGADAPGDRHQLAEFQPALATIRQAAADAGLAVGLHCDSGDEAAAALADGFTFASISCDLDHLSAYAGSQLAAACASVVGGVAG
jgi:4-hydroxy-2-oxoheptanedioate aldolase